ncbi:MAG TPA: ankyrin repeat domain-containing protein [Alphaproteobacteria bacterium]
MLDRRAVVWGLGAVSVCAVAGATRRAAAEIDLGLIHRVPLADAAAHGDFDKFHAAMLKGESPNIVDNDGRTALELAVINEHLDIVEEMIKYKVNCNARDREGNTALMLAAQRGFEQIAILLIRANTTVNLDNREGLTALTLAAQNGHLRVVELLVKSGADLTIQDRTGRSALDWAEMNNKQQVVNFLRKVGAKS